MPSWQQGQQAGQQVQQQALQGQQAGQQAQQQLGFQTQGPSSIASGCVGILVCLVVIAIVAYLVFNVH